MSSSVKRFDAFLSYNSKERPAVQQIFDRLTKEKLHVYFDVRELAPGQLFQPELADALRDSKSCVVFLGPNGLAPWQKEELQVAVDRRAREEAFHVILVLLPGTERPRRGDAAHLEFLINASWVEFLKTLDDERAFRNLVWGITWKKPAPPPGQYEGVCPYRGLEPFRPEDARFFFGRDNLTGWLVSALRREVRATQGVHFLAVLGPSGSGKSSVVLAGLVPSLKAGAIEGSERWPVAILRPGDDPLKSLAAKVVPPFLPAGALPDAGQVLKLIDDLHRDARTLDIFAQTALHDRPEDVRLAVVVDQFEEVFTYRPQDDQVRASFEENRNQFFANLLHAAATPGGRVAVVLTMRSDFLTACAPFPQLAAVLSAHQELVGPMTEPELREAIEQPAVLVSCEVEPGLTQRLLADVRGQRGALPLLQFALTEVWKKRDVRRLTLDEYKKLGKDDKGEDRGIEGVLEHRADEIYDKMSPEEQEFCRRLFLRLVQPGEGTEDTKRRASYRELLPGDTARAEAVRALIRTLADRDARLVTTEGAEGSEGTVEVAHEALIRGWTKLRGWVDSERAGLRTQRRLTEAAHDWEAAKPESKADYLYSGARLAVCQEWAKSHLDECNPVETQFLAASEEAERLQKEKALADERRQREVAEETARRQRQLKDRFLWGAAVAGLFAIAAVGLAIWGNEARKAANGEKNRADTAAEDAKAQARIARSRQLAAISELELNKRFDRSLLLAVEAYRTENTDEARNSLLDGLQERPGLRSFLETSQGDVLSVAFSPDGKSLAAGYYALVGKGGGVVLWDVAARKRLTDEPLPVKEGTVGSVAFSPDGKTLAAGYYAGGDPSGGVVLWDVAERKRLADKPLLVKGADIRSIVFSPDGKTLAAGYSFVRDPGGGVVLWDVAERKQLTDERSPAKTGGVYSISFSPDGKTLAAGYNLTSDPSGGGGVALWNVAERKRLTDETLAVKEGFLWSIAFSSDGKTLAAGYDLGSYPRGGVVLWDVAARKRLTDEPLSVREGDVRSVTFSPDDKVLAAGYYPGVAPGGGVVLWDVGARRRVNDEPLHVKEGKVLSVAFSRDGKTLATGYSLVAGSGGGVVLWDEAVRERLTDEPFVVKGGRVMSAAFNPDGKVLAAGYYLDTPPRGGVMLWDVVARKPLSDQPLPVNEGNVRSVAFSPDGKTLAAGYEPVLNAGGGVVLWDVATRQRPTAEALPVKEGKVWSVAFSPDGKTLAAGYYSIGDRGSGVVLWDVATRKRLTNEPLLVKEGDVRSVTFSPDSKVIAAGYPSNRDAGGGVVLWDTAARQRLTKEPLMVQEGSVMSVAFSPDGKTLAAGYYIVRHPSGGVVLWDVAARQRLTNEPLPVKEGNVTDVAFSPDGKSLAAGYDFGFRDLDGGGVQLWDIDVESWVRRAGIIANRNFTRDEWRQYFPGEEYRATFPELPVPPEVTKSDANEPAPAKQSELKGNQK